MTPLRIAGVPEHFNEPWKLAIENGAFGGLPLTVEFHEYPGGTGQMIDALKAGEADIATLLTEGAVADYANRANTELLGTWVSTPLEWGIHVQPALHGVEASLIPGRRVAISRPGSGSHLMALLMAKQLGWSHDSLQLVTVGNLAGAREAFAEDRADIFLWERIMTLPLVQAGEFGYAGVFQAEWPAMSFVAERGLDTRKVDTFLQSLPLVRTFCTRLKSDKAWGAGLIGERHGIPLDEARQWLGRTRWGALPVSGVSGLKAAADGLLAVGNIDAVPDFQGFMHDEATLRGVSGDISS